MNKAGLLVASASSILLLLKPPRKRRSKKEGNEASEGVLGVYLYTADCMEV
jgi:hypothetical protein